MLDRSVSRDNLATLLDMAEPNQAESLHEHAVQAEKHAEALATGLAQAQADPATVKVVTQCADVFRKIVMALGKGQEGTGDNEPRAEPPPEEQPPRETVGSATDALAAEAQRRAQGA